MTPAEQRRLIEMAQAGSIAARNELIEFLTPWIRSRCAVRGSFLDCWEDIVQQATIAVIRAIETFDLARDVQPLTYFANRIKGEIADYWRNQLPPGARRASSPAFDQHRTIRTDNFAEWVHPVDEIPELRREDFEGQDLIERLAESLGERDGQIVRWRFGQELTMAEIARRLGVSESLISITIKDLLPVLRSRLASHLQDGRPLVAAPLKEPPMGYDVDRELRSLFEPGRTPPKKEEVIVHEANSRIPLRPDSLPAAPCSPAPTPAATQPPREAPASTPARRLSARELATQLMATDQEDLDQFDREILVAEMHLEKLKRARKVIASCVGGPKPPKPPKTKAAARPGEGESVVTGMEAAILEYLAEHGGPAELSAVARQLGKPIQAVRCSVSRSGCLRHLADGRIEAVS